jgi:pimeloyl-ACP methyl ester carboxylesterase
VSLAQLETGPAGAPLVVLVHGSMDRMNGMAKVARRLDGDLRVLRYDRRGYAGSLGLGGPFTVEAHVDDLLTLLDERPAVVVGHSFGGVVTLAAAARRPDLVRAVAVFEPPLSWLAWWPGDSAGAHAVAAGRDGVADEAAERFLRRLVSDRVWERLPAATKAERRAEGEALVGELGDLRVAPPFAPAAVTCPVRVARGEHARAHHVRAAELLAGWFSTTVVVLPDAHHGAHLSHPDEFAAFARTAVEAAG